MKGASFNCKFTVRPMHTTHKKQHVGKESDLDAQSRRRIPLLYYYHVYAAWCFPCHSVLSKLPRGISGLMAATRLIRSFPSWQHFLVLGSLGREALALSPLQTCYFPDGSLAKGNFPCFLDQEVSPCCGVDTICEASGLCKVEGSAGVSDLIRGACTDPTWDSPECPQYCIRE
jgi:hypothetical protein